MSDDDSVLASKQDIEEVKTMIQELKAALDDAVGVEGVVVRFLSELGGKFTEVATKEAAETREIAREAGDLIADMHRLNARLAERIEADTGLRLAITEFISWMTMKEMVAKTQRPI